jgi:hypothetical protein
VSGALSSGSYCCVWLLLESSIKKVISRGPCSRIFLHEKAFFAWRLPKGKKKNQHLRWVVHFDGIYGWTDVYTKEK